MSDRTTNDVLTERLKKHEERSEALMKNVYTLLNLYSVFLGVIIASVVQMSSSRSSSKCHLQVYFITFAVVPFLLYGVPLTVMAREYVLVKKKHDLCLLDRQMTRAGQDGELRPDVYREMVYKFGAGAAIFILFCFNGLVIFACHSMLCGDKRLGASDTSCPQVCNKICAS